MMIQRMVFLQSFLVKVCFCRWWWLLLLWSVLLFSAPESTSCFHLAATSNRRTSCTALPMADKRLSHAMLMVPSVPETVDFWLQHHHGNVIRSSKNENDSLKGAFVVLGNQQQQDHQQQPERQPFALELTTLRGKQPKTPDSGSNNKLASSLLSSPSIAYIGVSLLAPPPTSSLIDGTVPAQIDPNGIVVRKVASAPGDSFLARFCLYSKTDRLDKMQDFYTSVIGMTVKAVDEKQLCLRFENDDISNETGKKTGSGGVPTTLVFENDKDKKASLQKGSCFDHLAIQVTNIDEEYKRIKQQHKGIRMCMELTEMFGNKVFGVLDPSGYKVIFFGQ